MMSCRPSPAALQLFPSGLWSSCSDIKAAGGSTDAFCASLQASFNTSNASDADAPEQDSLRSLCQEKGSRLSPRCYTRLIVGLCFLTAQMLWSEAACQIRSVTFFRPDLPFLFVLSWSLRNKLNFTDFAEFQQRVQNISKWVKLILVLVKTASVHKHLSLLSLNCHGSGVSLWWRQLCSVFLKK